MAFTIWDSVASHAFHAGVLRRLKDHWELQNMKAFLESKLGPVVITNYIRDANEPGVPVLLFRSGSTAYLYLGGVQSLTQGTQTALGYYQYVRSDVDNGLNPYIARSGVSALGVIDQSAITTAEELCFIGHSLGGAVAVALAVTIRSLKADAKVWSLSFGSPKPGIQSFADLCNTANYIRLMCDNDPIPYLAPAFGEDPVAGVANVLNPIRGSLFDFVQPPTGYRLSINGSVTPSYLSLAGNIPPTIDCVLWAAGIFWRPVYEHLISTYESRLLQATSVMGDILRLANVSNEEPPAMPTRPRENPSEPQVAAAINTQELAQQMFLQRNPLPVAQVAGNVGTPYESVPVNGPPFTYLRQYRRWVVLYRGTPCVICKNRKQASGECRKLNRAIAQIDNSLDWAGQIVGDGVTNELG